MNETTITPMDAYATTDGRLFHDKLEAHAHQYGLDITPEVKAHLMGKNTQYSLSIFSKVQTIIEWEVERKLKQLKNNNV